MKRALVLSGGGAKGAFQFGALKFIHDEVRTKIPGYDFNIISGVSVGSLNGVMWAMDKFDGLETVWNTIRKEDVYTGEFDACHAIWRMIRGKKSVLSNGPLRDMLRSLVRLEDIKPSYDYRFGVVSLADGRYRSLRARDFSSNHELVNGILASTAMPVIWEPVREVKTKDSFAVQVVDGGIRNVSPLGDIIDDDPDEIVIINCSPETLSRDRNASKNIFTVAKRALTEITIDEIFRMDIRKFLDINYIISQLPSGAKITKPNAGGKFYKAFQYILIEPDREMGDTLDFSEKMNRARMTAGYDVAKRAYEKFYRHVES